MVLNGYERSGIYGDLLSEMFCHLKQEDLRFIVSWVGIMDHLSEEHLLSQWDRLDSKYRSERGQAAAELLRNAA
jgi:hypothetical protein